MKKIAALYHQPAHAKRPYLMLAIDGVSLDEWFYTLTKSENFLGLAPALSWLNNPDDESVAWQRILPLEGCRTIAPLLICPDDQHFGCTTIVAEVHHEGDAIVWERFGLDRSPCESPDDVGSDVEWFGIPALRLLKTDYLACLERFGWLRLNKEISLDEVHGRPFALIMVNAQSAEPDWAIFKTTAHLSEQGMELHQSEGEPFVVRREWLSRIKAVDPDLRLVLHGADYFLTLQVGPLENADAPLPPLLRDHGLKQAGEANESA